MHIQVNCQRLFSFSECAQECYGKQVVRGLKLKNYKCTTFLLKSFEVDHCVVSKQMLKIDSLNEIQL